jgi:amino acid adenylation domain-containing protein
MPTTATGRVVSPTARMYMIYTSGSTGRPKGVVVSHRSFANFIHHVLSTFCPGPEERFALVTSPSFDMTLTSNWGPFVSGASLHVQAEEQTRDVEQLLAFLEQERISLLNVTPSHLSLLAQALPLVARVPALVPNMRILLGGESISVPDVNAWLDRYPTHDVVNEYGPTEATVASTFHSIPKNAAGRIDDRPVPIGRPIANTRVYVLTEDRRACMPGVPGYLYLGGAGVAEGYWGKPDRTSAAFVPDPSGGPDARMYSTGDMARFLPDGSLLFLGRRDHQVNLRGYRIELGEVEAALQAAPNVREAAVDLVKAADGNAYLAAFCAPAEGALDVHALRESIRARLPEHMVPTQFVAVAALPRTPSEKLDRAQLRRLAAEQPPTRAPGRPPATATERRLLSVWASELGTSDVGVDDEFSALGVDSLRVIRLVRRAREEFAVPLSLADVFTHRSIAALARALEDRVQSTPPGERAFVVLRSDARPRARLVGFPYAGGTAAAYSALAGRLENVEILGVRYPGHDDDREPSRSIAELAQLVDGALSEDDVPSVLLGVSFGAYVALEVCVRRMRRGRAVRGLVLGSATPPGARDRIMELAGLDEAAFRSQIAGALGTAPMTPIEMDRYLELLRIDTRAMVDHEFAPIPSGPRPRVVLVTGTREDDPIVARQQHRWLPIVGDAEHVCVDADHLLVGGDAAPLAAVLRSFLPKESGA